ncbi:MAG: hypothetical protein R3B57_12165 [Phycisphaerales bacterium]
MHGFSSRGAAFVAAVALATLGARAQSGGLHGPRPDEQGPVGWSISSTLDGGKDDAGSTPRHDEAGIPLGAPKDSALRPAPAAQTDVVDEADAPLGGSDASTLSTSAVRTLGALGLVVALILALAWAYKRVTGGRALGRFGARAPSGLVEVLARYPLPPRHTLVVLRFGQRVLLVSQPGKGGEPTTLCELDDPAEVAGVLEIVRESDGRSINARFREAISEADEMFESALERAPMYEQPLALGGHATPEPDRAQLLGIEQVSPLRRRLDAMRGGVYA